MSTRYTNVNDTNVIPFNNKDVKHEKKEVEYECTEIYYLTISY